MGGIVVTTFEKITAAPAFGHICCMIHLTSISFLLVFGTYFFYNSHSPFKALHWTISCFTMAFASFFIFIFTNITQQSVLFPTDHQAILDVLYSCITISLLWYPTLGFASRTLQPSVLASTFSIKSAVSFLAIYETPEATTIAGFLIISSGIAVAIYHEKLLQAERYIFEEHLKRLAISAEIYNHEPITFEDLKGRDGDAEKTQSEETVSESRRLSFCDDRSTDSHGAIDTQSDSIAALLKTADQFVESTLDEEAYLSPRLRDRSKAFAE